MKKSILTIITILLVLALGLFTLTGCTKEKVAENNEVIEETEDNKDVADENTAKEEESDIDVNSLSDEEKVEHVLYSYLKKE